MEKKEPKGNSPQQETQEETPTTVTEPKTICTVLCKLHKPKRVVWKVFEEGLDKYKWNLEKREWWNSEKRNTTNKTGMEEGAKRHKDCRCFKIPSFLVGRNPYALKPSSRNCTPNAARRDSGASSANGASEASPTLE
ncbi:hypothetical protein Pcinc_035159 [Petrolisthes cinctipes]|uniref:Uncharacterized protein n=1 Tax=Petrolisthes cinctipes TaxID=88211 RepID=A0AAE1BX08_PETCI|nr:hypothetical protein Pcinc_035159 [Petrolisthes cinctipes]